MILSLIFLRSVRFGKGLEAIRMFLEAEVNIGASSDVSTVLSKKE
jgi:hypothetical protein